MLRHSTPFLLPCLLAAAPLVATAQEDADAFNPLGREVPHEELDKQLRVQLEWYEVKDERASELLDDQDAMRVDGHLSSDASPLRDAVRKLVEEEKATLLETALLVARSGQRAKVESVRQHIYPTEYDPAGMLLTDDGETRPETAAFSYLPQATAFETRNVGVTLEVDPVLGPDERVIDLNLAPEIVYLAGHESWGTHREGGSEVEIRIPTFYTLKTETQVTLIGGEYFLLGAQNPLNEKTGRPDPERMILMFLKTEIVYTGLPLEE